MKRRLALAVLGAALLAPLVIPQAATHAARRSTPATQQGAGGEIGLPITAQERATGVWLKPGYAANVEPGGQVGKTYYVGFHAPGWKLHENGNTTAGCSDPSMSSGATLEGNFNYTGSGYPVYENWETIVNYSPYRMQITYGPTWTYLNSQREVEFRANVNLFYANGGYFTVYPRADGYDSGGTYGFDGYTKVQC